MQKFAGAVRPKKRIVFLFTVLIFIFSQAFSQEEARYNPNENSLLWEITGNELQDTSYLFGTYHFAGSSFLDTLPVITNVFKKANTVIGEIKMENEILVTAQLIPHMKMDDARFDQLLSPSEYKIVNNYLTKISNGLTINMFKSIKPAALQLVMMRQTAPVKIAAGEKLMDLYFQQEGEKLKKEIIGLETIKEQGKLLFGLPIKRQKKLLLKFVKEADTQERLAKEIFDYYRAQDLENLENLFERYNHYNNEELKSLMKNRNKKWMEKLPGIMKKSSAFIAVGGGHLIGKYGLISLLRKAGYTVRPINTHSAAIKDDKPSG